MTQLMENSVFARDVTSLLSHYGFESNGQSMGELVKLWEQHYPHQWVRLAAIEALYQGRYKAVSVGQILATWQRRGHTIYHFNHEFERLISRKVPQKLQPLCFESSEDRLSPLPVLSNSTSSTWLGMSTGGDYSSTTLPPEAEADSCQYLSDYIDEVTPPLLDSQPNLQTLSPSFPTEAESIEDLNRRSIDRFIPTPDRSDVYLKLMALSQESNL
ncbi:hypothetical protein [Merismopedia glauca]|uniref:DnaD domain-containing protein n=1 Tax=Merismopedia glauca CCAP 1448/3 TaxID=1296344 RepID=A0A2T1BXB9_9CYAN|nr:hypothetical protein [Merismopedia glauca]PSB00598.1 hypothetical protein C7B64_22655 [Merismopedia glauca CCAP 1448/3]